MQIPTSHNNLGHMNFCYTWRAKNQKNMWLSGKLWGMCEEAIIQRLSQQGLSDIHIKRRGHFLEYIHVKKIALEILPFLKQFIVLLKTHVPLVQAWEMLLQSEQTFSKPLKSALLGCLYSLKSGLTLAKSLRQHSKIFSNLLCHWVSIGEESGSLAQVLTIWIKYQEQHLLMQQRLKKAFRYPCFILIMTLLVAIILLFTVIPTFSDLFHQFNHELPWLTRIVLKISEDIKQYGAYECVILVSVLMSFIYAKHKISAVQNFVDIILWHIPYVRLWIQESLISQWTRVLSQMLASNFSLSNALIWSTQATTQNYVWHETLLELQRGLSSGIPLHQTMEKHQFFPKILIQMIKTGELSGTLEPCITSMADFYEYKVSERMEKFAQWMEPGLMLFLSIIVGVFIIAMYLPMFQMGNLF